MGKKREKYHKKLLGNSGCLTASEQEGITGHFQRIAFWKILGKLITNPNTPETQDKLGVFMGKKCSA